MNDWQRYRDNHEAHLSRILTRIMCGEPPYERYNAPEPSLLPRIARMMHESSIHALLDTSTLIIPADQFPEIPQDMLIEFLLHLENLISVLEDPGATWPDVLKSQEYHGLAFRTVSIRYYM
ncbi:MAG: hypothetical protein GQ565_13780 [Candidatus Aegiribacteria sp.]|nr:hypothetical protein [Candidatus Aegiribacteria sp.]